MVYLMLYRSVHISVVDFYYANIHYDGSVYISGVPLYI